MSNNLLISLMADTLARFGDLQIGAEANRADSAVMN
jgi:hypothetical protein